MTQEKMELGMKMDVALHYVAYNLRKTGHNTKPVLFHSFKVAYKLYQYGYGEEIVIAGALHDLIEDTSVTKEDIKNDFEESIANIVSTVSFDSNIKDEPEQAGVMFQNCIAYGIDTTNETIRLSYEHTKMEWLSYEDAKARLKWDSNRNALWELNWKLLNNKTDL